MLTKKKEFANSLNVEEQKDAKVKYKYKYNESTLFGSKVGKFML